MILISLVVLIAYLTFYIFCFSMVLKSRFEYLLYYVVTFFPVYTITLVLVYNGLESSLVNAILQYSKELFIFSSFYIILFGKEETIHRKWDLSFLDRTVLSFLILAVCYLTLSVGEASFLNQAVYLKNILLIGLFYFFGRQIKLEFSSVKVLLRIVFTMTILALMLVCAEKLFSTHFHSLIGYVKYNQEVKAIDPGGVFGLTFTFEAQGGLPRYGSFFSNPLEFSASMLIPVALGIIMLLSVEFRNNKWKYILLIAAAFVCVLFAYSRATFAAFFLMLLFMAFLLRYYKLLTTLFGISLLLVAYVIFFASEDTKYFVLDTLTFQNSSSVTHIIEWVQALESMISDPFGIGLATSGNAGGVDKDLQIGGENQYLIYGVQLGFIGMTLYVSMLLIGIRNSWRAFRMTDVRKSAVIPFMASAIKFGLLLPLFTANAEAYIYVALFSWWLIGSAETQYQRLNSIKRVSTHSNKRLTLP